MGLYENKNGVLSPIAGRGNIDGVYKAQGILGAKNMLNVKASTAEIQGVTYTVNSDKTITVNGTATVSSTIQLSGGDRYKIPTTDGLVVHKGNSDSVHILIWYYDSNKNYLGDSYAQDTTEEKLKLIIPEGAVYFECALRVYSNQTVSNVLCKPMLTLESDTDSTYQPYAMTNKELTYKADYKEIARSVKDGTKTYSDQILELKPYFDALQYSDKLKAIISAGGDIYRSQNTTNYSFSRQRIYSNGYVAMDSWSHYNNKIIFKEAYIKDDGTTASEDITNTISNVDFILWI